MRKGSFRGESSRDARAAVNRVDDAHRAGECDQDLRQGGGAARSVGRAARGGDRPAGSQRRGQDDDDPDLARLDRDRFGERPGPGHGHPHASGWRSAGSPVSCPRTSACSPGWSASSSSATRASWSAWAPTTPCSAPTKCSTTSGLGEARYRRVESYSTGMKQRLKIASAIVHDPRLLILDEPTNGMDPAGRDDVLELTHDLAHNKGMSLLFSSHLLPDVEAVCDHVMVLGRGRLLAQGRIDELKQPHDLQFELRVKGDQVPFAGRLAERGISATPVDDHLLVVLPTGTAAAVSGKPRSTPESRSARFDPGGARSKKSFSTPSRKKTDADLRPGIPALAGHALRPSRPMAGDHPPRRPHPVQEPWGPLGHPRGLRARARCSSAFLIVWGLFEKQSSVADAVPGVLPEPPRGAQGRPARLPHDVLDPGIPPVLRHSAFLLDDSRAPGRSRPDQPGPEIQRHPPVSFAAGAAIRILPGQARASSPSTCRS